MEIQKFETQALNYNILQTIPGIKLIFFFVVNDPYNQQIYSGFSIGCVWSRMPRYTQTCTKY